MTAIIELVLAGRIFVQLTGRSGFFADALYSAGGLFQAPFDRETAGIVASRSVFQPETVLAMVVYASIAAALPIGWVLAKILILTWRFCGVVGFVTARGSIVSGRYALATWRQNWPRLVAASRWTNRELVRQYHFTERTLGRGDNALGIWAKREWYYTGLRAAAVRVSLKHEWRHACLRAAAGGAWLASEWRATRRRFAYYGRRTQRAVARLRKSETWRPALLKLDSWLKALIPTH